MLLILSGFIVFGKAFINLWVGSEYMDAYYEALYPEDVEETSEVSTETIVEEKIEE